MDDKRVLLGRCGAAHGIRGEVRVKAFTASPDGIAAYGPLELEDGSATLEIERMREADTVLIVKFKGLDDRSAAEKLNGIGLTVLREMMPATEDDDEFYLADLIGLRVEDQTGRVVGDVLNVVNFGAGDILEIQPPRGTSVYLPFSPEFVPDVDLTGGRVVIAPPDDLFKESVPGEAPPKKRTRSPRARDRADRTAATEAGDTKAEESKG
jgi:16S rRNA processing protein RimM